MSSSTSNSDPPRSRFPSGRRLVRDFATIILLFATVEAILRFSAANAFESLNGGEFRSDVVEQAILKSLRLDEFDAAIVGSSVTGAVRTDELSRKLNGIAERFVLYSANEHGTRRLLEEVILKNSRPRFVVYVISPRDVNCYGNVREINQSIPSLDRYRHGKVTYFVERFFNEHLLLYRHRAALQRPTQLWRRLRASEASATDASKPEDGDGIALESLLGEASDEAAANRAAKRPFLKFAVDEQTWDELRRIDEICREKPTQLVLLLLPVNSQAATSEYLQEANQFYDALISRNTNDFEIIDLRNQLADPRLFRDSHHLNDAGASVATEAAARQLRSGKRASENR